MEKTVLFRDYQKAQTDDFVRLQTYVKQSFDDIVGDAVTASLRYAGFNTVKSNTAEITVAAGRFYGMNANNQIGAVYTLPTQSLMSVVQYLCVSQVTQRILTLVCYGSLDQTDVQTRDFLTNTQTLQTQPQSVAMTSSRDALLGIVAGAEAVNPVAPAVSVGQVAVASILVNYNGIISVTQLTTAQVASTEQLDGRMDVVEGFDAQIGPKISALAADIANLANQLSAISPATSLILELMQDVALLKAKSGLPATYAQYGASYFMWADPTQYDTNNSLALGFNCTIQNGIRFPAQNAAVAPLSLFNPIDPNASYDAGSGLLLPAYTEVLSLRTGTYSTSVSIGQYGYQTFVNQVINVPYSRFRYGGVYYLCGNSGSATYTAPSDAYLLPNFTSTQIITNITPSYPEVLHVQVHYLWLDTWTQPYWTLQAVNQNINGALIAQSFLVSSDQWITRIGIYLHAVASPSANITINLCQCTNGQPDLTKIIGTGTLTSANLVVGMNYLEIHPAYVASGTRMAVTVISNVNHQLGLAQAGSYLAGTFFYSLDGTYFLGDFTKEMVLEIYSAQFNTNQTTIQFNAQNLQGGIRAIDLMARMQVPASCQLTFESQESGGSGAWLPVSIDPTNPVAPFADAPVLLLFRGRFVGSPSIMPGIWLPDSFMNIWCPGPTFTFVSELQTLTAPTGSSSGVITVQVLVQNFNLVAHSLSTGTGPNDGYIALYWGGPLTRHNPTGYTVSLVDAPTGTYSITATFNASGANVTSNFSVVMHGTTNSVANVFLVGQMVWWVTGS